MEESANSDASEAADTEGTPHLGLQSSDTALVPKRRRQHKEPSSSVPLTPSSSLPKATPNPIRTYLDIKKKMRARYAEMQTLAPTPPSLPGFENFAMVKGNYLLQGHGADVAPVALLVATATVRILFPFTRELGPSSQWTSIFVLGAISFTVCQRTGQSGSWRPSLRTLLSPPEALPEPMTAMFAEQESARYKLRLQHRVEWDRLRLHLEQELLREHRRAERLKAGQSPHLSFCFILRTQDLYHQDQLPQPQSGQQCSQAEAEAISQQLQLWLANVKDKFEKFKQETAARQRQEADCLQGVQRADWQRALSQQGLQGPRPRPSPDDPCVPRVEVFGDMDLLPE